MPTELKITQSIATFCRRLKTFLFHRAYTVLIVGVAQYKSSVDVNDNVKFRLKME